MFRTHDGDGSGSIEFDEFLKEEARSIISDRSNAENRKQATRVDGLVPAKATAAENPGDIAQVLTESQVDHAKLKFDDLDKDGSGTIEVHSPHAHALVPLLHLLFCFMLCFVVLRLFRCVIPTEQFPCLLLF